MMCQLSVNHTKKRKAGVYVLRPDGLVSLYSLDPNSLTVLQELLTPEVDQFLIMAYTKLVASRLCLISFEFQGSDFIRSGLKAHGRA